MENRLYRSRSNRMIAGVCGGLAKYFNIDPVLIRLIFVLSLFLGGVGFIAYIILAIVVPLEGTTAATPRDATRENIEEIKRTAEHFGEDVRSTFGQKSGIPPQTTIPSSTTSGATDRHGGRNAVGIIIILIGVFMLISTLGWFHWNFIAPAVLIIIGLIIILSAQRRK